MTFQTTRGTKKKSNNYKFHEQQLLYNYIQESEKNIKRMNGTVPKMFYIN